MRKGATHETGQGVRKACTSLSLLSPALQACDEAASKLRRCACAYNAGTRADPVQPCDRSGSHLGGLQLQDPPVLCRGGERLPHGHSVQVPCPLLRAYPARQGQHRQPVRPDHSKDAAQGAERGHVCGGRPQLHGYDPAHQPRHRQAGQAQPRDPCDLYAFGWLPLLPALELASKARRDTRCGQGGVQPKLFGKAVHRGAFALDQRRPQRGRLCPAEK